MAIGINRRPATDDPVWRTAMHKAAGGNGGGAGGVVVAGMHRSGGSLTAALLAALGVRMSGRERDRGSGDAADSHARCESLEVIRFHQRLFAEQLPADAPGYVDWGWTAAASVDAGLLHGRERETRALVAARSTMGGMWGLCDPRVTPVLDFWHSQLAEAVYVAVYRSPTAVADSMQRMGVDTFLANPGFAWPIWRLYNQRLLDFVQRHRDRCVLFNIDALPEGIDRLVGLLQERFRLGPPAVDPARCFDPDRFTPVASFVEREAIARSVWPECFALYEALERHADLPLGALGSPPPSVAALQRSQPGERATDLSIVIPTYNDAVFLVEALASVAASTGGRYDVQVLDDGSTAPESVEVLNRLGEAGYPVSRQPNRGLSATRNAMIRRAKGRFILPLDADNRLVPGFIERALGELEDDPGLGVVYGDRQLFGAADGVVAVPDFDPEDNLNGNQIDACAIYRREVWDDVGGYDEQLDCFGDWEFWVHAGKRGWRLRHLPGVAFEYRVRPGSMLAGHDTFAARWQRHRRFLQKHPDLLLRLLPGPLRWLSGGSSGNDARCWRPNLWQRIVLALFWIPAWERPRFKRRIPVAGRPR
jgi:GT2 family glycosyltransferase